MLAWEHRVLGHPPHHEIEIPPHVRDLLAHLGYREHAGAPKGQDADYRKPLPDGRGFHVRDYGTRLTVHWDRVDPTLGLRSALGHLVKDTPWLVAGVAAAGVLASVLGLRTRR